MLAGVAVLLLTAIPAGSAWRAPADAATGAGELLVSAAPLMQSIVALIFVFFLIPGVGLRLPGWLKQRLNRPCRPPGRHASEVGTASATDAALWVQSDAIADPGSLLSMKRASGMRTCCGAAIRRRFD